MEISKIS